LICLSFVGVSAAQDDAQCYTLASINGTYGTVATYGSNVALALAVRHYDGKGNFTATFIVNEPGMGADIVMGSLHGKVIEYGAQRS
jgi:hypothetical protein